MSHHHLSGTGQTRLTGGEEVCPFPPLSIASLQASPTGILPYSLAPPQSVCYYDGMTAVGWVIGTAHTMTATKRIAAVLQTSECLVGSSDYGMDVLN